MSEEGRLFFDACGASGPLRFEWIDPTTGEPRNQEVQQPALIMGCDPTSDLVLDDPSVDPFHVFLHLVDGRLFVFDLDSTTGVRWGEIPRAAGWVDRGQALRIGRFCVRLVGGDRDLIDSSVEPAPTSARYLSRRNLPGVVLDFRQIREGRRGKGQRGVLDRVLVLGGSSERCKLKFEGNFISKFTSALIRTPKGLWMTNIVPGVGATVNGALCRFARLEDDDVIQVGQLSMRVIYDGAPRASSFRALSSHANTSLALDVARETARTVAPFEEASPEILLRPLLEQAGSELGLPSSPFGQALVLMIRLLGDVHRDHLTLVRDELAQIRRLGREMDKLRSDVSPSEPGRVALEVPIITNAKSFKNDSQAEPEEMPRPHPEVVHEIVSERLEAWERERQSRWRKLLRLLVQS